MSFQLSHITNPLINVKNLENTKLGKNLFDKKALVNNSYIKSDGTSTAGANVDWYHTDYIPVIPGKVIHFSSLDSSYSAGTAFYKGTTLVSWISNTDIANNKIGSNNNKLVIVPENVDTMRCSAHTAGTPINEWQIEYGNHRTSYEEYKPPYTFMETVDGWLKSYSKDTPVVSTRRKDINLSNYSNYISREKYDIWKYNGTGAKIEAVYRNIAVRKHARTIEISTSGINGPYDYKVTITSDNFPGLLPGSNAEALYLIPWQRNMGTLMDVGTWRLVVVTTHGQIYHNFPSRATTGDGAEIDGDIIKFDESVVWDIPGRKMPSTNTAATGAERYYPGLRSTSYEYQPVLNTDDAFIDRYSNGGFGNSIVKNGETLSRFFEPNRHRVPYHSFGVMGGYEPGEKTTLMGTYRSNMNTGAGSRICVFATSDGGRTWFTKYEFASGNSVRNWTDDINTTSIPSDYTPSSFVCRKRNLNVPSGDVKEPAEMFSLSAPLVITNITRASVAVVTTSTPHNLGSGSVIVIQDNPDSEATSTNWNWMRNDTASNTSGGNGMMFKILSVDATTFELHDYIHSPFNNITCRHIHHINAVKDGWIIGTGEVYPDGWQLYAQLKEGVYTGFDAGEYMPFYRLNSSNESPQRTLGAILYDDSDCTYLTASDSYVLPRVDVSIPGRTETFSRTSSGVYAGKLSEIDEYKTKHSCIFEMRQTVYYFKEKCNALLVIGRIGETGISFDKGKTWHREELNALAQQTFKGESSNMLVVGDFIFEYKI